MKYLVDYEAHREHDSSRAAPRSTRPSCPQGFLGAIEDAPYKLDVAKAKELLAKAGLARRLQGHHGHPQQLADQGSIAQAIQATMAQAGIETSRSSPRRQQADADQVPGAPARHLYRPAWGPDYQDPQHQRRHLRLQHRQQRRRQVQAGPGLAQRMAGDETNARPWRPCSSATPPSGPHVRADPARAPDGLAVRDHGAADRERGERSNSRASPPAARSARPPAATRKRTDPGAPRGGTRACPVRRASPGCRQVRFGRGVASSRHARGHLPGPPPGHLPDRPRGADRSGTRRCRRPRLGRGFEGEDAARSRPAAVAAVPDLHPTRPAGRFRHERPDLAPGDRGHRAGLPGHARARHRRHHHRRAGRDARWGLAAAAGRAAGPTIWSACSAWSATRCPCSGSA